MSISLKQFTRITKKQEINNIINYFVKNNYWVMNKITPFQFETFKNGKLNNKTILITGGSRGIGLAIAKKAAKDGANIAILAKTIKPHPKLEGTIFTAAQEIEKLGGAALPLQCDIRDEKQIKEAISQVENKFKTIDIVINNASAINLSKTEEIDMKKFDLMNQINLRGTFMVSKYSIKSLKQSENPHILNLSPPLTLKAEWFGKHCAYTIAKYGMSMCVLGLADELKPLGIGVNALWPKTTISTAAINNLLGGSDVIKKSRTEQIVADAAYVILTSNSRKTTGNFFIDDEVLASVGVTNFQKYKVRPEINDNDLSADFFV